jgi:Tol biopolymer transport system component
MVGQNEEKHLALPIIAGNLSSPAWSADKKRIFFLINDAGFDKNGIYSISTDTLIFRSIFKDAQKQSRIYNNLISSIDNKYLIFSMGIARTGRSVTELYKMSPSGLGVKRITKFETALEGEPKSTECYAGAFTSNQEYLYFSQTYDVEKENKKINIYRINMKNDGLELMTSFEGKNIKASIPSIHPNGNYLLVNIDEQIIKIDINLKKTIKLENIKGASPKWNKSGDKIYFILSSNSSKEAGIYEILNNSSPTLFHSFREAVYTSEFAINF